MPRPSAAVRRFAAYQLACWGLLAVVAWSAHPLLAVAVLLLAAWTTLPLLAFVRNGGGWRRYPTAAFRLGVVRPVLYAQLLLPLVATAGALGLSLGALAGDALAWARWAVAGTLAVAAPVLVAGWVGSRRLGVREIEARVPGLPAAFDGLRIVQLSDLHVGPHTSRRFLDRVTATTAALRPDLVTITGDLVDDRAEDVPAFTAVTARLRAPLGVFLIPGNHDVYAGWDAVEAALRARTDAHVLVNDVHLLRRDGAVLALLGTGDPAGMHRGPRHAAPDVAGAFARVPPGVPVVAFAHNPALWPALAGHGAALTLSGHTHWGQLALPRHGWSLASPFQPHAMGGYQEGDALLFVHPGTGFWGIPFRLGAYPEVTAVTLRRAEDAGLTLGARQRAA
jgi:predicted MPP superfamily phosphohydrolase